MALYLQTVQTILWALVHHLHEIARVGADVMWVKCQQESCMPMLCVLSSSDSSTVLSWLSQRLGIGVKSYPGSTWARTGNTHWWEGRCMAKFSGKPLLPSKQHSKNWSSHLGFDSTEAGQCLSWEGGEEGMTEMKARNEDLSKYLCNPKESKWRSGHNTNTQLGSERKEAQVDGRVNAPNDSGSTGRQKKDGHGGKCWIQEIWADARAFSNRCLGDRRSGVGLKKINLAETALRADITEEVDELGKDGKDKEKGALWDTIRGLWRKCDPPHQW